MQKLKDQKGFSILDGLLVVIALVAIGAAGYFAYQAHHTNKVFSVKGTAPSSIAKAPAKTTTTPAPNYLVISQLGLKFQTTGLTNLVYSYSPSAGEGNPPDFLASIGFTSSDFANCYNGGGGDDVLGGLVQATKSVNNATKIGQYYYFYTEPQSACVSDSLTAEQQNDTKILQNDLKTLQAN
jgi:hypothetical protein